MSRGRRFDRAFDAFGAERYRSRGRLPTRRKFPRVLGERMGRGQRVCRNGPPCLRTRPDLDLRTRHVPGMPLICLWAPVAFLTCLPFGASPRPGEPHGLLASSCVRHTGCHTRIGLFGGPSLATWHPSLPEHRDLTKGPGPVGRGLPFKAHRDKARGAGLARRRYDGARRGHAERPTRTASDLRPVTGQGNAKHPFDSL